MPPLQRGPKLDSVPDTGDRKGRPYDVSPQIHGAARPTGGAEPSGSPQEPVPDRPVGLRLTFQDTAGGASPSPTIQEVPLIRAGASQTILPTIGTGRPGVPPLQKASSDSPYGLDTGRPAISRHGGRGKPLPCGFQESLFGLGREGPWGSRQNTHRERLLGKARRSRGTAPAAIFANPGPGGPAGIEASHSDFARRKFCAALQVRVLRNGVRGKRSYGPRRSEAEP